MSLLLQVFLSKFSRSSTGFIPSTCLFRLHESPTILHKTLLLIKPFFFCAPFPWNTDRTLTFTENTDICCYKKELLTLLVFLICSEINRLKNDFQDFQLSMCRFQQFLTYDSALISPKTTKKPIAFKNYILGFALLFRFCIITQFFFIIISSCHREVTI